MEVEEVQAHYNQNIQQNNEQVNTRSSAISTNRLKDWHHSRIIRVSRASGGKDRHSKVMTSKGLRDRRVRLSVSTAIQFYDLQDRLGYDQPSKAVEWLINAAADAIAELPSLDAVYTSSPKQQQVIDNEKRGGSSENGGFENCGEMNQQLPLSKSACSSNSETSRGSGLSLARPDVKVNRVKARERARGRAAKEKESTNYNNNADESFRGVAQQQQPSSQNGSFTELLTTGFGHNNAQQSSQHQQQNISFERVLFHKPAARPQQQMDYNQLQFSLPLSQAMFSISGDHHHRSSQPEMQHFSYVPDYIPVSAATANSGDHYNLNFSMSSSSGSGGLAGFNGGTLQSNSTAPSSASLLSPHHHFQRFAAPMESNNVPFFLGGASASAPTMENHQHQHHSQFPFGLQLYGDGSHRHSDHKGKAKN